MKTCREDGREDGMSVGAHGEAAGADGVAEGAVENQRPQCTSVWLVCCLEGPNDEACEEVHSDG